jgi:mono/diheme cytochrome c family protein
MVAWKGLVLAGLVSSSAIVAASLAPAGAGSSDAAAAAFVRLAQNDTPAAGAAAETPAATGEAPAEGAATSEAAATEEDVAEGEEEEVEGEEEEVAVFTEEFLADPVHQESGKVVWETCAGCHGARAYPGKGPKLRPKRYTPDFVFDRVTHGYKKMPAWKDVFTKEERMDVVAYILSPNFTP